MGRPAGLVFRRLVHAVRGRLWLVQNISSNTPLRANTTCTVPAPWRVGRAARVRVLTLSCRSHPLTTPWLLPSASPPAPRAHSA